LSDLGILIDENLSPELVDVAQARGLVALSVSKIRKLRGRRDYYIAKYAIDNDMTLVTNNMVDFEVIYQAKEAHPGLIFLSAEDTRLFRRQYQKLMLEAALNEFEEDEPIQEAIVVTVWEDEEGGVNMTTNRYYLPDP
jgi:predicted nuclease of predicted toxin-antitoxin system